jgi:hypothetical protein
MIGKDVLKRVFVLIHLNYANNKIIKRKEKPSLNDGLNSSLGDFHAVVW